MHPAAWILWLYSSNQLSANKAVPPPPWLCISPKCAGQFQATPVPPQDTSTALGQVMYNGSVSPGTQHARAREKGACRSKTRVRHLTWGSQKSAHVSGELCPWGCTSEGNMEGAGVAHLWHSSASLTTQAALHILHTYHTETQTHCLCSLVARGQP